MLKHLQLGVKNLNFSNDFRWGKYISKWKTHNNEMLIVNDDLDYKQRVKYEFDNGNLLFGNQVYYMKDADVREILDTFGSIVTYDVATSTNAFAANDESIPTAGQVYDYVGRQIGAIGQALNLRPETSHTAEDMDPAPAAGDFIVESDGSEWLFDGSAWREIGSENAYVVKTTTIAGVDLQDNITAAELQ